MWPVPSSLIHTNAHLHCIFTIIITHTISAFTELSLLFFSLSFLSLPPYSPFPLPLTSLFPLSTLPHTIQQWTPTTCSSAEAPLLDMLYVTPYTHCLVFHQQYSHLSFDLSLSLPLSLQGPVWALCVSGDMLFSASSDNTIKVPHTVQCTTLYVCTCTCMLSLCTCTCTLCMCTCSLHAHTMYMYMYLSYGILLLYYCFLWRSLTSKQRG